jgi:hypothetical protein
MVSTRHLSYLMMECLICKHYILPFPRSTLATARQACFDEATCYQPQPSDELHLRTYPRISSAIARAVIGRLELCGAFVQSAGDERSICRWKSAITQAQCKDEPAWEQDKCGA